MHRADFDLDIEMEWSKTSRSQTRCGFVLCQPLPQKIKKIDRMLDSYSNGKNNFLIWSCVWLFGHQKTRLRKKLFFPEVARSTVFFFELQANVFLKLSSFWRGPETRVESYAARLGRKGAAVAGANENDIAGK
ncbi:hypothetical protein ACLEDP_01570 [Lonsdalea quercina]|uniref:hypothetical protein n=1 Tax=Lonsdalea quercina TaxID=71657 RepID=UPI0039767879